MPNTRDVIIAQMRFHNELRDAMVDMQGTQVALFCPSGSNREDEYGDISEDLVWTHQAVSMELNFKQLLELMRNKDDTEYFDFNGIKGHARSDCPVKSGDFIEIPLFVPPVSPNPEGSYTILVMEVVSVRLYNFHSATAKQVLMQPARYLSHRGKAEPIEPPPLGANMPSNLARVDLSASIDGVQAFNLPNSGILVVFAAINGQLMDVLSYSISGTVFSVTANAGVLAGDTISVLYLRG